MRAGAAGFGWDARSDKLNWFKDQRAYDLREPHAIRFVPILLITIVTSVLCWCLSNVKGTRRCAALSRSVRLDRRVNLMPDDYHGEIS